MVFLGSEGKEFQSGGQLALLHDGEMGKGATVPTGYSGIIEQGKE